MHRLLWLSTLLVLAPGCGLYLGDHPKPLPDAACFEAPPSDLLRDPQSGQCEGVDPGGGACDPGPVNGVALPDWAPCSGPCNGLDEAACEAASGCRAIFVTPCSTCGAAGQVFEACWGTAPSGPIEGGSCTGLDAQTCSQHDDCIAVHAGTTTQNAGVGAFEACAPEPTPPPACSTLDEQACVARSDCQPLYDGHGCTCDAAGCTCTSWTFASCTSGGGAGFSCGDQTCAGDQICEVTEGGPAGSQPRYSCAAMPASCGGSSSGAICGCLQNAGVCATQCSVDAAGNVTTTCQAP